MNLFSAQKKRTPLFLFGIIAFATMFAVPADAFGQRSRSSSRPKVSKPKKSKPANSRTNRDAKPAKKDQNSWGKKKSTNAQKNAKTKADRALYDRAKKNGTHFNNRNEATAAFKKSKGAEISANYPTKFSSKPATRPDYIPQSTSVGGNTYNISYNDRYGGYGYMDALGTFMLYDMMTDQMFMNQQMRNYGYAYGPPPARASSGFALIGTLIAVLVIGGIIVVVVVSSRGN